MMRQAWKTMVTGRPGPVVLDVPFDIFKEEAGKTPDPLEWSANISCRCGADPEGVAKAAEMLIVLKNSPAQPPSAIFESGRFAKQLFITLLGGSTNQSFTVYPPPHFFNSIRRLRTFPPSLGGSIQCGPSLSARTSAPREYTALNQALSSAIRSQSRTRRSSRKGLIPRRTSRRVRSSRNRPKLISRSTI